jgi:hypothetical protein
MKKGTRVAYIPNHVHQGIAHKDAEFGVVKRLCEFDDGVFVIYDQAGMKMITGDEDYTAAKTNLCHLRLIDKAAVLESIVAIHELSPNLKYFERLFKIIEEYNLWCPEIELALKLI